LRRKISKHECGADLDSERIEGCLPDGLWRMRRDLVADVGDVSATLDRT
jgi:hypothetical protein